MILQTKRLVLRPWQESDAEALYKYASDPQVGPAAGWPAHGSVSESRTIIREVLSAPETYAVILKSTNEPVGCIGFKMGSDTDLTDREDEAEIGYWIGVPFWGLGLIPEAVRELLRYGFEELQLKTIWCGYYDGNEKSRRVQEKCGFTHHHTTEDIYVPHMDETRTGHVSSITSAK